MIFVILLIAGVDITPKFSPDVVTTLLYLGVLVTGVGYGSYFLAIEKGGSIMASFAFFLKPVLTPFVTLFINGITPDVKALLR